MPPTKPKPKNPEKRPTTTENHPTTAYVDTHPRVQERAVKAFLAIYLSLIAVALLALLYIAVGGPA